MTPDENNYWNKFFATLRIHSIINVVRKNRCQKSNNWHNWDLKKKKKKIEKIEKMGRRVMQNEKSTLRGLISDSMFLILSGDRWTNVSKTAC